MEPLGLTLHTGTATREWCDDCLTSAVVKFDLLDLREDGVRIAGFYRRCQRCHGED